MSENTDNVYEHVGPVLQAGTVGTAIVEAIKDLNKDVLIMDRGAYIRVLVPHRCIVSRSAIEKRLGRSFRFPGELEMVMSGFKGAILLTENDAVWQFKKRNTGL
jgi:toluene monooxygenase system protein D